MNNRSSQRIWFWSVVGVVLLLVVALGVLHGSPKGLAQEDQLSKQEQTEVLAYARALLEGEEPADLAPKLQEVCGKHVFLELFRHKRTNFVFAVSDEEQTTQLCLPEAIARAVQRLSDMPEFTQGFQQDLANTRVALELQATSLREIAWKYYGSGGRNARSRKGWILDTNDFSPGLDGLFLTHPVGDNHRAHWVPPMEAVAVDHGFGDLFTTLREFASTHLRSVGISSSRERAAKPNAKAFAFHTQMILESQPGNAAAPLNPVRGNVDFGRVDADDLYDTATRMTDYLVRVLDKNGKFDYEYYPNNDKSSSDYNIVRHAGTTYSILFTHKLSGDPKYLEPGLRAKNYITKKLKAFDYKPQPYHSAPGAVPAPFPGPGDTVPLLALAEGNDATLGATALSLLAFAQIPVSALSPKDKQRIQQMANFVWFLQCESGGFYRDYKSALKGKCPDPQPRFYPGETLLALNALHQTQPNPAYLAIAERSIKFELDAFYGGQHPDHWVMQTLELMQINAPEAAVKNDWIQAGLDMGRKYIERQYMAGRDYARSPKYSEYDGAVSATLGLSNNSSTGSMSEAIAAIYRLMKNTERKAEQERFGDHLLASGHLLTREMYRPENTFFVANPEKAMWGLPTNPVDQSVRIDANQHALVAVWGAWQVAVDRGGIGWPLPQGEEAKELQAKAVAGELVTKGVQPQAQAAE